jgi:peptidoglycan hydrolase-like protein with peptidoglycan-binding domain
VQIALLARRYYHGAIDGTVGPMLRKALRQFQKSKGLEESGTITPGTLDALLVSSE